EQTRSIKFLLDSLFEQANDLEAGRDVLTRLLNRKFLPVVMAKEVLYARQSNNTFGVLAIDVDHFKRINDTHGHDAGDQILQQVGALLASNTRGG
ncbi:MAG TPA: diguanylate cyclase, partial [Pseudomonas sp.]|nr:diguanylate cyclase [Pseudomonas sp.]